MDKTKSLWIILALAVCGVLFSGYLSFSRLILQTCPLNEPCAIFLGLPTCVFGFIMYLMILAACKIGLFWMKDRQACLLNFIMGVSMSGILFSGYFTLKELFFTACPGGACHYALGLPTCSYGMIMYIAVFVVSFLAIGWGCCMGKKPADVKDREEGTEADADAKAESRPTRTSEPKRSAHGKKAKARRK